MVIQVEVGKGLQQSIKELKAGARDTLKAMSQAVDDTTRQLRSRANREIRTDLAVKAGDLKNRIRRQTAYKKSNPKLVGRVYISERPVKLSYFKQTQTPDGASVRITKGGQPRIFRGAFGPKIGKLKGGVYDRTTDRRFPLRARGGVPLAKFSNVHGATDRVRRAVGELLPKNIRRRLNLLQMRARKAKQ